MSQRRCVTSWGVGDFYSFPWTSSRRQHRVRFHNGYQKSYNVPLPHAVTHFPPINPLGNVLYPSSTSPPTWGPQTEDGTSRDTRFDQNRTYPQLHPLLTREHSSGSKTLLDLSSHAFSPKRSLGVGTPIRPFTYDELLEPATVPPVRRINVAANFLPDWAAGLHENSALESLSRWKSSCITIPLLGMNGSYVTVYDVLASIYVIMQGQISHDEWAQISILQSAVTMAYIRRCSRYPDLQTVEESKGIRRVDCLCGQYMFHGIVASYFQGDVLGVQLVTVG